MYIDESYDRHSRYIVLSGFMLPESQWSILNDKIKNLKLMFFNTDTVNLKTIRRKDYDKEGVYNKLSSEKKDEFTRQFYDIITNQKYTFMAALIDRDKMEASNKSFLFQMAYSFLIQRFQFFLEESEQRGIIIMDKSKNEEVLSLFDYHRLCLEKGVPYGIEYTELRIREEIVKIKGYRYMDLTNVVEHLFFLDDKYSNHLQIADMVCSAISMKFNRNNNYYYSKIERNIRRCKKTGKIEGFGIKIFPS